MHEMSIATAICEQVLATARANGLASVTQVRLRMGGLRLIVPEALTVAWQAAAERSIAEGAALEMIEVTPRARCKACGNEFEPEWPVFVCPRCSQASVEILAGEELVLEEITGEQPEASRQP